MAENEKVTYGGALPPSPSTADTEVAALARSMTNASRSSVYSPEKPDGTNPFLGTDDPRMDPLSGKFEPERWTKAILQLQSSDPEGYPHHTAAVSFSDLSVYGYGRPTDHQKTVGNYFLDIPGLARDILGRKGQRIDILRNFEGVIRESEMLVVLGRPGSGCTTLLKTIAGETHGFWITDNSHINYQGISFKRMHKQFRGEVIYNAENDVHFPNMTVGQTLRFAAEARTPRTRLPGVSRSQWAEHMKDVVMSIFGLTHTVNTKVGNDFVRGVSGGERKRVSIAEVALSGSPLQCWDNSTRGLDSATALEFVKSLRLSSKYAGATAVVAIYQASQAIYDLFDKVVVLYEGQQIYFGRADRAKQFFIDMGFECPPRQTTADFLTSLTNPGECLPRPGFEGRVPRTADEFAAAWRNSRDRQELLQEIERFNDEFPEDGEHLEKFKKARKLIQAKGSQSPYTLSTPMQIRLCLKRAWQRFMADTSNFLTSVIGNFILALIISSIFYNLPQNTLSFYSRGALLFFAILMNAFASSLEILQIYEQRPIVEKHKRMALYHPYADAIASVLCDLPGKVIASFAFNLVLYFMTNLRRTPGAFFTFYLFSLMCILVMSMIFRTIGATSKTISQAMAPSSVILLALVIFTGFTIPTRDMLGWSRWINYINPIGYAFESIMVNEFDGREYACGDFIPTGPGYTDVPATSRVCASAGAVFGSDVVEGAAYIATAYEYFPQHKWRNLGILFGFIAFFACTYLFATEFIAASKSKGEVLVFRRGHVPLKKEGASEDEEAGTGSTGTRTQEEPVDKDANIAGIQRQVATFHWEDVIYDIKIKGQPRRILDHVDGWVRPGTLTALMGASGAGKTTLLDTLANRVTMGVVEGKMQVDGHDRDSSFQRNTGYVQQQDLHLQTSTVREAMLFSARLRQPHTVPDAEKAAYVEEVIHLLEMQKYADAIVGVPGEGLNVEQRKRLTIGVELVAKPQLLLFLDEPTSGLDSQTAWSICTLLRKLANNGQAILCTIHQPSAMLFQSFDRLLLLQRGGQTVYFGDIGENSRTIIDYFEGQGADPCPHSANPAEWMLSVIGAAPGAVAKRDYYEAWRGSEAYRAVKEELRQMRENPKPISQESTDALRVYAAPFHVQLFHVTFRFYQQLYRTPSYIYSKIFLVAGSNLLIGFSFFNAHNTIQGLQNQMYSVFMGLTVFGNLVNQIMPHFVTQRSLYEVRERPSRAYSWVVFMLSNVLGELPWNTLAGVVLFFCWYYPVGMYRNAEVTHAVTERGGLMFLLIWQFMLFTSTFAHMLIAGVDSDVTGGNIASLLFSLTFLFCGVLAGPSGPNAFPRFWIFMYRLSPFTYLVEAMVSVGVANAPAFCSDIEVRHFEPPSGETCGQYLQQYMSVNDGSLANPNATADCQFCQQTTTNSFLTGIHSSYAHRWRNFGFLWVFILFNIGMAVFFYWLARVPKGSRVKKQK
uniref:ABC-type transporter eriD n=1 Tax=Hericium erinaceus TaxID=91752 RepID=ERID_HERER|nr:RecName: Full=ABC-type transporter eriD; AltName: Full=Erinacine biosynthesis cluster protein D [Hericium erinaceus]ARE72241.1 ABC-transporter [Hericium erinaceus]